MAINWWQAGPESFGKELYGQLGPFDEVPSVAGGGLLGAGTFLGGNIFGPSTTGLQPCPNPAHIRNAAGQCVPKTTSGGGCPHGFLSDGKGGCVSANTCPGGGQPPCDEAGNGKTCATHGGANKCGTWPICTSCGTETQPCPDPNQHRVNGVCVPKGGTGPSSGCPESWSRDQWGICRPPQGPQAPGSPCGPGRHRDWSKGGACVDDVGYRPEGFVNDYWTEDEIAAGEFDVGPSGPGGKTWAEIMAEENARLQSERNAALNAQNLLDSFLPPMTPYQPFLDVAGEDRPEEEYGILGEFDTSPKNILAPSVTRTADDSPLSRRTPELTESKKDREAREAREAAKKAKNDAKKAVDKVDKSVDRAGSAAAVKDANDAKAKAAEADRFAKKKEKEANLAQVAMDDALRKLRAKKFSDVAAWKKKLGFTGPHGF